MFLIQNFYVNEIIILIQEHIPELVQSEKHGHSVIFAKYRGIWVCYISDPQMSQCS